MVEEVRRKFYRTVACVYFRCRVNVSAALVIKPSKSEHATPGYSITAWYTAVLLHCYYNETLGASSTASPTVSLNYIIVKVSCF